NLDQELSLDELAEVACFSQFHFHRIFSGMVGESVKQFVRRLRLERAAEQLRQTEKSIIEIALTAGYETHESFTRTFKTMFHLSPSQFRTKEFVVPWLMAPSGVHFGENNKLETFKPIVKKGFTMNVEIKQIDPMRVAYVRHVGPYNQCEAAWGKLCGFLGPKGLLGPQSKFIGLSYDDPEVTPPDKIRYDACVTVPDDFKPEGDVQAQTIQAGEYAVTLHEGPYENLSKTYAALCGQWLAEHNREIRQAPSMEIYLNSPQDTKPEDLKTEIYMPLEPVKV
ncbi:MAG: AraC family transcriptional regulator, partial [Planctomycetes bacterium]|nr:AraC family transcriptional regulator [Planctomycetota bacterium]